MNSTARILLFVIFIAALFSAGQASHYLWLTDDETTWFGNRNGYNQFMDGDTLDGPIHSNSLIAIMGSPVFTDLVTTTEEDFWRSTGYAPVFLGPQPVFNAPLVTIPTRLERMREEAGQYWFDGQNGWISHFIRFRGDVAYVCSWTTGIPFDSSHFMSIPLIGSHGPVIFVDGPLRVEGVIDGHAFVGCSGTIEINGDITYADSDSLGRVPSTSTNFLVLAAEGDIKIRNTPQNGRWNSNGRGFGQTNPDSTGVVISAQLYALGQSLTFEQQNDPDSGYVSEFSPDERGIIHVFGSVVQRRRGHVHRATNTSTGYRMNVRFDPRLRTLDDHVNEWLHVDPDTLSFGDVALGQSVVDTVMIDVMPRSYLGTVTAAAPFSAQRLQPYYANRFAIPVTFTPSRLGIAMANLGVVVGSRYLQIPLRGRGVAPGGPLTLTVGPNPFNSATLIRYTLPVAGDVKLTVYDVLGRTVQSLHFEQLTAGEHRLRFDASALPSGLYVARLESGALCAHQKLLLIR